MQIFTVSTEILGKAWIVETLAVAHWQLAIGN